MPGKGHRKGCSTPAKWGNLNQKVIFKVNNFFGFLTEETEVDSLPDFHNENTMFYLGCEQREEGRRGQKLLFR